MGAIGPCELPSQALLARYGPPKDFVDAYRCELARTVTQAEYVEQFYRSAAFRPERLLLGLFGHGAGDTDAAALASGERDRFAAWRVEARSDDQLLLCDVTGRTRSWLHCQRLGEGVTRLYFGSAVVGRAGGDGGPRLGWLFHALLPFHRRYSQLLLGSARRRLLRAR